MALIKGRTSSLLYNDSLLRLTAISCSGSVGTHLWIIITSIKHNQFACCAALKKR